MTTLVVGADIAAVEQAFLTKLAEVKDTVGVKWHLWPNPYIQSGDDRITYILIEKLNEYVTGGTKFDAVETPASVDAAIVASLKHIP